MAINELTQAMAEQFIDNLPDGSMPIVKFQGAYLQAAKDVGWIDSVPLLRKDCYALYQKLSAIWKDAETIPNA